MEHLSQRLKIINNALDSADKYFENIEPVLSKHAKDAIEDYNSATTTLRANMPTVGELSGSAVAVTKYLSDIFEKFSVVGNALNDISRVINVEKYLDLALLNRSRTWASQLQTIRSRFTQSMNELKNSIAEYDEVVVEQWSKLMSQSLLNGILDSAVIDVLLASTSTNFITYASKYIMDWLSPNDRSRLLEYIEEKKDLILEVKPLDVSAYTLPQRLLNTFGLYPTVASMTCAELMKLLSGGAVKYMKSKSDVENLLQLSNPTTGIVVINKSGFNAIEYNAITLLDLKYVMGNNLQTSPIAGINNTSVARYSTMTPLVSAESPPDDIAYHIGDTASHAWVVETIDGVNWRVVGDRFVSGTLKDEVAPTYSVDASIARSILTGASPRPLAYSRLHESVIVPKFDPTEQRVATYPNHPKMFTTYEGIKLQIVNRLNDKFREFLENSKVDDAAGFLNAVRVQQELILRTTNYIIGREMDLDKLSDEFKISFVIAFDNIAFEINKQMQNYLNHLSVPEMVFKQFKERELHNQLALMYRGEITAMFERLDEYPSYFAAFEIPLKVYMVNKKVFLH